MNARAPRTKHLLRRVLARYVPDRLVERPKMGFGVPLAQWLRGPLRDWADALMNAARARRRTACFARRWSARCGRSFSRGEDRDHYLIWNVLMFQDWYRCWGNERAARAALPSAAVAAGA